MPNTHIFFFSFFRNIEHTRVVHLYSLALKSERTKTRRPSSDRGAVRESAYRRDGRGADPSSRLGTPPLSEERVRYNSALPFEVKYFRGARIVTITNLKKNIFSARESIRELIAEVRGARISRRV